MGHGVRISFPTKVNLLALLACGLFAAAEAKPVDIPSGTHVLLRMTNSISSRTAQQGDYVYMRTASPISLDGRIAVPVGSYVQGVVSHVRRSGRVAGRAELGIRLDTLTLPNGKVFKISPRLSSIESNQSEQTVEKRENLVKQGPDHGRDAARIAILAGSGASIGGIADRSWKGAGIGAGIGSAVGLGTVLLSRGREVDLRHGNTLDVVFHRPVTLE